jgi:quinol monooxygenase YgiN
MSVRVVAHFTALPGHEDTVRRLLEAAVEPTRRESGCLEYDLNVSTTRAGDFVFIETWEDEASLDSHGQSAHIAALRAEVRAHLESPPDVRRYRPIT